MNRNRHNKSEPSIASDVLEKLGHLDRRSISVLRRGENVVLQQGVKFRRFPVCWGVPMDELCFSLWVQNFLHLNIMPWDNLAFTNSTYLPTARNAIHKAFLAMDNCNWLVMLDSDVLPPPDFVDRMLAHNKLMVGGWYRKKTVALHPVVYDHVPETGLWRERPEPGTGLEKVGAAGAGCWLMHRKVAEAIGEQPYNLNEGGEDLHLCKKVRAAGFDIWIDWNTPCAHAGVSFV